MSNVCYQPLLSADTKRAMKLSEHDAAAVDRIETIYLHLSARHEPNIAAQLTVATIRASQQPAASGRPMTVKEVADRLQLTPQTVYELCKHRTIKAVNLSGTGKRPTYRITEEALGEYMKDNERHKLKPPAQFKHLKVKSA